MSWLESTIEGIKDGTAKYLSSADTPVSGVVKSVTETQKKLAEPTGIFDIISSATQKAIGGVLKGPQDNSAKIQADGSFLTPGDATGVAGISMLSLAIIGVGAYLILKRA